MTSAGPHKIAIVGAAGRFPGAANLADYWQLLLDGRNAATEPDASRGELWRVARDPRLGPKLTTLRAGYMADVATFDAEYFSVSPREAVKLDPQQRILLEVAHDALEDAGLTRGELARHTVGVFVGVSSFDYMTLDAGHKQHIDGYYGIGSSHNLVAGRISYFLNLKGPSLAIDTACSSSLTALHYAVQSLQCGEIDLAIVGGVNLIVSADLTLAFSQAKMLSPSGRCKTFAADADGYGRAEAAAAIVLRRVAPGEPARHPVRCYIAATAVNQDGRSNGIAAPNGASQVRVVRAALDRAGLAPADLAYVEAHGTGTSLGDAIELAALQEVIGAAPGAACFVGSAKASIGHAEAAAGISGLLKGMLILEHGVIPPHPVAPPHAAFFAADGCALQIAGEARPIEGGRGHVGISSFGFGGSNAHVVLERAEPQPGDDEARASGRPVLLALSSHVAAGLAHDARALADHLAATRGPLAPIAETLMFARDPLAVRRACVARTRGEAIAALREPQAPSRLALAPGERPKLAFAFTGQGAQAFGMGRALYEAGGAFRAAFDRCEAAIAACAGLSIAEAIYDPAAGGDDRLTGDTHVAQLALFAYEYALASQWQALGVVPALAIGHSIGELVAHTVAGALTLEAGAQLIHERGLRMQAVAQDGAMIAVSLDAAAAQAVIDELAAPVYIAAVNGRRRVVISGARPAIDGLVARLDRDRIRYRPLRTRHAFHSPIFAGAAAELAERARGLAVGPGAFPVIGNLDGAVVAPGALDAGYWGRHIAQPVQFAPGVETLVALGTHVVLEIGPDRVLASLVAADHGARVRAIASATRGSAGDDDDAEAALLRAAGALYELGVELDFAPLCQAPPRIVSLPPRRLAGKRYWTASADEAAAPGPTAPAMTSQLHPAAHPGPAAGNIEMTTEPRTSDELSKIQASILHDVAYCLKEAPENLDPNVPFADMGADSLILLEALQEINTRYGVALTVLEIYERVNTVAKVARFVHERGGRAEPAAVPAEPAAPVVYASAPHSEHVSVGYSAPELVGGPGGEGVEDIVRRQLALMERQLGLLSSSGSRTATPIRTVAVAAPPAPAQRPAPARVERPALAAGPAAAPASASAAKPEADRFSAFSVKLGKDEREDDAAKLSYIQQLIARVAGKAPESKRLAQRYRQPLADNRVSAGFRPLLKEMVFPIVAERAEGARITDVDGNTYVDFTMGFGAHFFGHAPAFVTEAIAAQLGRGMPIGPQSPLAGRVAELVCELTGHARVTFCNSGTEATMTALRLARARTGRAKVVTFRNSYHGSFDGFLARGSASSDVSRPASLGTPASLVADTIVLDYCEPSALAYIERHAGEIAAVLAEPVQSRAPSMQPQAFLRQVRKLTEDHGIALIFDEVIAGFRCARGGAQELFGVRADLCTYGKILGGGMPIGVVAGSAPYMDGLDGGFWQYGDDSFPAAQTIFFAGTFSKHPLAMAAAVAVLEHIRATDAAFYRAINDRTQRLARALDAAFEAERADLHIECFSSLFRFASKGNLDVFFYRVLDAGYFIWEGRNCFVSTAHTEEDLAGFVEAIRQICRELVAAGLIPVRAGAPVAVGSPVPVATGPVDPITLPIAFAQQRFLQLARSGGDGAVACNLCYGLRFDAAIDLERLAGAVRSVLTAHDALWAQVAADATSQRLAGSAERALTIARVASPLRAADPGVVDRLMADAQKQPLAPEAGETVRAAITTFADGAAVLSVTVHHLVCDGWALAGLFERIAARYAAPGAPTAAAPSYARWLDHEARYRDGAQHAADRTFWHAEIAEIARYQRDHAFGAVAHHNAIAGRPGGRARLTVDERLTARFKAQAKADGVTPFTALLAGFQLFLHRAYRTRLPVIGIPFANRTTRELKEVVGSCVNLLPLLPYHEGPAATFDAVLAHTKRGMSEMFAHALFPYDAMCAHYRSLVAPDAAAASSVVPVEVTFNVEPISQVPRFEGQRPALLASANDRIEFDLMCNVFVLQTEIAIELDYDTRLFAEDAVYGLLNLYAKIVENYANRAEAARRASPVVPAQAPSSPAAGHTISEVA